MGLDARKSVFGGGGVVNNKGADQPALPRGLISAFVIPLLCDNLPRLEWDDDCKALAGLIIGQLKNKRV